MDIVIPEGSIEIQTGLWAWLRTYTFNGQERQRYNLYSAEGYCFYEVNQPENYDEDGNLLPPEDRVYARYAITGYTTIDELNANYVSVPMEDGYEIVSVSNGTVTE